MVTKRKSAVTLLAVARLAPFSLPLLLLPFRKALTLFRAPASACKWRRLHRVAPVVCAASAASSGLSAALGSAAWPALRPLPLLLISLVCPPVFLVSQVALSSIPRIIIIIPRRIRLCLPSDSVFINRLARHEAKCGDPNRNVGKTESVMHIRAG